MEPRRLTRRPIAAATGFTLAAMNILELPLDHDE
jgi:hypothetical protein